MNIQLYNKITINFLKKVFIKKNYKLEIGSEFVNMFGVRANTGFTNTFDDIIGLIIDDGFNPILEKWEGTTDPGKNGLLNPLNEKGVAIVAPGYYKNVWKSGLHKGKYPALVQIGPISVYRDNNKDSVFDFKPSLIESGYFGINCHHAGVHSLQIDDWSMGCQVLAILEDDNKKMKYVDQHVKIYPNSFNYILLEEKDFI
jgi:hypothetical protein